MKSIILVIILCLCVSPILSKVESDCHKSPNLTVESSSKTSTSFSFSWVDPENSVCVFDGYRISVEGPVDGPFHVSSFDLTPNNNSWTLRDLKPGRTYVLMVQTINKNFTSFAAAKDVTLRPLPVRQIDAVVDDKTGWLQISWKPNSSSLQDNFKIRLDEIQRNPVISNNSRIIIVTNKNNSTFRDVVPGRNYSIGIKSVSQNVESEEEIIYQFIEETNSEKTALRLSEVKKIEMKEQEVRERLNLVETTKNKLTAMRLAERESVDETVDEFVSKWRWRIQDMSDMVKFMESWTEEIHNKLFQVQMQIKYCIQSQLSMIEKKNRERILSEDESSLHEEMDTAEREADACIKSIKEFLKDVLKKQNQIIKKRVNQVL